MTDIARQLGVSTATVSKAVNGKKDISPETRQRVEEALERAGYRKSLQPAPGTHYIEVVIQFLDNNWAMSLLHGVQNVAAKHHACLSVSEVNDLDTLPDKWLPEVLTRHPIGVVLVCSSPAGRIPEQLSKHGIPCVFLDPSGSPSDDVMSIQADNWSGGMFATRHLLSLGHRRIAVIAGPSEANSAVARFDGYRAALQEAGVEFDPSLYRQGHYRVSDGERFALDLLRLPDPPTAIFAESDLLAMGVYKAAKTLGVRIPEDLSVVGFDDIQTAAYMGPALTTVRQPLVKMAERAASMVFEARSGKHIGERFIFPTTLVVRESTRKLRA